MKIKMFLPIALVLCLAFSLCACGTTTNTNETTTAPATTTAATEATTTAAATTAPATTAAATEADDDATSASFTSEDALELVNNTYEPSGNNYYRARGTFEVEGVSYFAIDLMKSLETNSTYDGLTYFVKTDGSDIVKGYIDNNEAVFTTEDAESDLEINEDNAVKAVAAAHDIGDDEFLMYKGIEEIDGVKYFAVDLRRSFEDHSSYLSTFFVTENGEIVKGYYEGDVAYLAE